jgi:hypothetical protein
MIFSQIPSIHCYGCRVGEGAVMVRVKQRNLRKEVERMKEKLKQK